MQNLIQYTEPLRERTIVNLTATLKSLLTKELELEPNRYKVNNKLAEAEVQRCALRVYLLLRENHPELFYELRDRS
jgi:hypothetical protein